jgi:glycosyltransferase involved in cell wall biosynthesis
MPAPQDKFSILFLGTQMEVAGAQRVLLSQAHWFHEHGYPVQAIFFYDKQGLAKVWQRKYKFPVVSLDGWQPNRLAPLNIYILIRGLSRLFSLLRKNVRAIVTFTPHSNLLGLPLGWIAGVPVRIGTHHGYIEGSSARLAWLHGRLINSRFCSIMVTVSAQVRQFALRREGANTRKLIVIENGIEPPAVKKLSASRRTALRNNVGAPGATKILLTVGRLTVQKGHTVLLDAIAKLKSGKAQPVFVFAGDGPLKNDLEEKARRLGIAHQVRFLGVRDDVDELLLVADIFVQPSLWEGLSLALLEALLAGLPVLATRVEGVVDVVENGYSALLVPPKNSAALATAIRRLLRNDQLRKRLSRAGQKRALNHYSVENMCKAYEGLLVKLIENGL